VGAEVRGGVRGQGLGEVEDGEGGGVGGGHKMIVLLAAVVAVKVARM